MLWSLRALSRRSSREVLAPLPSPYAMFVSLAFVLATVVGCGSENYAAPEQTNGDPVFVGAGDIADCYEPTWGQEKHRTKPVPGDNDYGEAAAGGYFDNFGSAAGDPAKGYYSYDF